MNCEMCGKILHSSHTLKDHIARVHFGKKDTSCDVCGKALRDKFQLLRHKDAVHNENAERVKCDLCGLSMKKLSLSAHKRNVHSDPVDCKTCMKQFSNNHCLRIHIKRVHDNNIEESKFCPSSIVKLSRCPKLDNYAITKFGVRVEPFPAFNGGLIPI